MQSYYFWHKLQSETAKFGSSFSIFNRLLADYSSILFFIANFAPCYESIGT